MNSDKNKRENRKALKIFIPIIFAAAVIGGVIGAFSATGTAEQIAKTAGSVLAEAMFQTAPYAVIFTVVLGIAMGFAYYRSAVRTFKACETETDEDAQYAVYIKADEKLSKGMMIIGLTEILSLIFFSAMIAYINRYTDKYITIYIVTLAIFVIGCFIRIKLNQLCVDFAKIMNPQKKGSVYDLRFQKKWEDSCYEIEKLVIYKASSKAYKAASISCAIFFVILMLCSFFFNYGPLPAVSVGIIWLITAAAYYREAIRLGKDKINL